MTKARDLMERHLVGVSRTTKVAVALKLCHSAKVNLMPVLEDNMLCGIVFEADLEAHRYSNTDAGKIMRNPIFVEADSSIEKISRTMIENGVGRIPVVQSRNKMICLGMLSSTGVLRHIKKH